MNSVRITVTDPAHMLHSYEREATISCYPQQWANILMVWMWSTSGGKNHWAPQLSHEGDKRSLKIKKLKYRFDWPAVFRLNGYHVLDSKRLLLGRRGVEQSDSLKDGWADRFVLVIPGLKTCKHQFRTFSDSLHHRPSRFAVIYGWLTNSGFSKSLYQYAISFSGL